MSALLPGAGPAGREPSPHVLLPDLIVLIGAHRADSPLHRECRDWLRSVWTHDPHFRDLPSVRFIVA